MIEAQEQTESNLESAISFQNKRLKDMESRQDTLQQEIIRALNHSKTISETNIALF